MTQYIKSFISIIPGQLIKAGGITAVSSVLSKPIVGKFLPKPTSAHYVLALVLLVVSALAILPMRADRTLIVDDAFIFMRYAHNVTQGLGFVWNLGEAPVEGYTSFSYLLLLVGVEQLALSQVVVVPWLGLGLSLSSLALMWRLAQWINPGHNQANLVVVVLFGLSPPFLLWSTAGMETPLYAAVLAASVLTYIAFINNKSPAWLVGLMFALAALTRPEALVIFCATVVFEAVRLIYHRRRPINQDILVMGMTFLAIFGLYYAWRWQYFGFLFPNTYYAKSGGGLWQIANGVRYLGGAVTALFGGYATLLAMTLLFVRWRRDCSPGRLYLLLVVACSLTLTILSGGDHFPVGRFVMPTLPFILLLMGVGLGNLLESALLAGKYKIVFVTFLVSMVILQWESTSRINWPYERARTGLNNIVAGKSLDIPEANPTSMERFPYRITEFVLMGQKLRQIAEPSESIAAVPIGAIGYYSNLAVLDMVGLVDPFIAHQPFDPQYSATWRPGHDKGDGAYLLSRGPNYVQFKNYLTPIPSPGIGDDAMQYKSAVEIWSSPEFQEHYEFYPLQVEGGWYYNLYRMVDK